MLEVDTEQIEELEVPDFPPDEEFYWFDLENGCE